MRHGHHLAYKISPCISCNGKNVPLVAFRVIISSKVCRTAWPGNASSNSQHIRSVYQRRCTVHTGEQRCRSSRILPLSELGPRCGGTKGIVTKGEHGERGGEKRREAHGGSRKEKGRTMLCFEASAGQHESYIPQTTLETEDELSHSGIKDIPCLCSKLIR